MLILYIIFRIIVFIILWYILYKHCNLTKNSPIKNLIVLILMVIAAAMNITLTDFDYGTIIAPILVIIYGVAILLEVNNKWELEEQAKKIMEEETKKQKYEQG